MTRRCLVLSASMGAGHDAVAAELARRLRAHGHDAHVHDVLTLLPPGSGPALRGFYRTVVRRVPALYTAIYQVFLAPPPPRPDGTALPRPDTSPLAALAERPLRHLAARLRPDVVVSTFHLAAQITGRMRERGTLRVPSAVYVTDFAVHRAWLHPGNDLYLCVSPGAAEAARTGTGRRTAAPGPVVPPAFHAVADAPPGPPPDPHRPTVLLTAGAWGVGSDLPGTARALVRHGLRPVVLCGRDEALRRRSARVPGAVALGWTDDLPALMATARLLVDNAAGQTAVQALAAGLPVVAYRPIPGHGAAGVRHMAAEGLTTTAPDLPSLLDAAARLVPDGPPRTERVTRGRALFQDDAAQLLTSLT
ncbi:MGDG synthase family glycosyltransferase [Streptomyces thermolilacinus]|uniref:Galactosyldiacylglycerol synthase n=1 Tax=Streptomyces thermolilacinus SPC6 TaxID=1306406 RepID=A0A1D3DLP2_9ACTN|nr:galactosyldiacylglycerol synthase [Streptomyces thermolilacinus]OEJ93226.1 galactosyldiacylglycerol synthase [Streptomyces thermolilacinus SPC6]